jgi:hypothetical protein
MALRHNMFVRTICCKYGVAEQEGESDIGRE